MFAQPSAVSEVERETVSILSASGNSAPNDNHPISLLSSSFCCSFSLLSTVLPVCLFHFRSSQAKKKTRREDSTDKMSKGGANSISLRIESTPPNDDKIHLS